MAAAAQLALLAGCATSQLPVSSALGSVPLVNASFETAPAHEGDCAEGWYCTTHAGTTSHRYRTERRNPAAGQAAFCMDRLLPDNWALLYQHLMADSLRGARVRLSMSVRADATASAPGTGPFLLAEGGDSNAVMHEQKLVTRTSGWQRLSVEGVVPANAWRLQVGALFDADGPSCVDDMRLEVLPQG